MNLYEMKLGESFWSSEMQCDVLRVPGGWLFRTSDGQRGFFTAQTFVPFDNEFMETSGQGEAAKLGGSVAGEASANSAITPPAERDCPSCANDGDCFVTVIKCKGYRPGLAAQ